MCKHRPDSVLLPSDALRRAATCPCRGEIALAWASSGLWLCQALLSFGMAWSFLVYIRMYQETACTARFEITDVLLLHGMEGRTVMDTIPLHGAARNGKPLRLHGAARTAKERRLHGAARTCSCKGILQPSAPSTYHAIYLTEAMTRNLEVHGPPCTSCMALHGLKDQMCCTELHRV